ncbi:ammonium transporter Rh type A-like isoform X2 [Pollicipes pollicipes]|uniref:ammonium transporter Rh type A-like n=1 Tax=Pollicipes pollicipes TaxID=41117 RepID=UPI001884A95C|nr:ammonium transporter Rh type A-like [Pollicipes pollicipes]XP_037072946.1 ammonium transporter Rh type A-like isoform X2 [Pollicipes pollicipes]
MARSMSGRAPHPYVIVGLQLLFVILFGVFANYATTKPGVSDGPAALLPRIYGMFQDVHIMIFVGFGFLMTFLKRYGLSAVSINFLIAAVVLQWALLVNGFFHLHDGKIEIDVVSLLGADFTAACVLISFGVVLGKTTPTQLLLMALIEVPIFVVNEIIGRKYLQVSDMGDSIFVHTFGAYFGLAVSFVLYRKDSDSDNAASNTISDLFSMIGTVFLWCFWPSFNSALAQGDDQNRAVINTYLSLCASCIVSFAVSALLDKQSRFSMEHVQNATLAGGVAIGTAADMIVQPYGALLVGSVAGALAVVGFQLITPALDKHCRIHDTCGVHNLHGMPGILASTVGAIMAAMASPEQYGASLFVIFPARAETALAEETPVAGRSASVQGGMQMLALIITLVISVVTGLLTGLLLKLRFWERLETGDLFSDRRYFVVHDEPPPEPAEPGNTTSDTHI